MSQFDPLVAASDYFLRKEVKARSGKEILARLRGIVCHTYTSVQEWSEGSIQARVLLFLH